MLIAVKSEKNGGGQLRENKKKRVICAMSGGVDSAVAAYLLQKQGYDVIAVFMKNWQDSDKGCGAARDYEDVQKICAVLNIPYHSVSFEKEYKKRVFSHFIEECKRGRTPNPDVLCNSQIKFSAFLNYARATGAKYFATGHYAKTHNGRLFKAADLNKDQTYFLCMLKKENLTDVLFPIGELQKPKVRSIAHKLGLPVADKKDSTGICFIGERNFRQFLSGFVPASPGDIKTVDGDVVGRHLGVIYYTLGQRRGLGIGGRKGYDDKRWFVIDKNVATNTLFVAQGDPAALYSKALQSADLSFVSGTPPDKKFECKAKFRYRQKDQHVLVTMQEQGALIEYEKHQRAITPGQYAALYIESECIGGGVIDKVIF